MVQSQKALEIHTFPHLFAWLSSPDQILPWSSLLFIVEKDSVDPQALTLAGCGRIWSGLTPQTNKVRTVLVLLQILPPQLQFRSAELHRLAI